MSGSSILNELSDLLAQRKANPPAERSYVVSLLQAGRPKIAGKIMEEAEEVVEAAEEEGDAGRDHLTKEVADLVFHAMVMLTARDLSWSAVEEELGRRFGISGITEKESRNR